MAKRKQFGTSLEKFPEEPLNVHIEAFVAFYGITNGYLERISEIKNQPDEIDSLRDVVGACVGTTVTATQIVDAIDVLAPIYENS